MRKSIYLLLFVLSLILVGCNSTELQNQLNNDIAYESEISGVATLNSDQNVLIFSTLSSTSVLSQTATSALRTSAITAGVEEDDAKIEIDMEKANEYLLMMENMLANGGPVITKEEVSDREGYESMMVISFKDLAGNVDLYTIYYSIIVDEEEVTDTNPMAHKGDYDGERDDKEHGDRDEEHDEHHKNHHDKAEEQFRDHRGEYEDEVEVTYRIEALAVIDGIEYEVFGEKEVETEDDETEVEMMFVVRLSEGNYVKIEQENEADEVEYKYTVYENGRKKNSMSFEVEEEKGSTFIQLTTTENGYKETYKFIKTVDKTIIKYESKGYSYTLFVTSKLDEATGELVYEYKVKEKDFDWEYRRHHKGRD